MSAKLRRQLLKELYDTHEDMVKIKFIAMAYFWKCEINMSFRPEPIQSKVVSCESSKCL